MNQAHNSAFPSSVDPKFLVPGDGLTKRELIALENHAQLIRFVQRGQMTSYDAAVLAVRHADSLLRELAKERG